MEKFLYERIQNKKPELNAWLAFPAIESFAMSSLGYMSIFKQIDLMDFVFVERVYSDSKSTLANPEDLDVIAFSSSFEIDIMAIIKFLEKYKIPLLAKDRGEEFPLIFAGGPVLTANPLPYQEFYDFICIGDANVVFEEIFKALRKLKDASKDDKLKALSDIDGVWVPKFGYEKRVKKSTDAIVEPVYTPILSDTSFFKNTFIIEIERGCPKTCNFCLASWLNLPVRYVETSKVIEAIDFGLEHTSKIALLGAYVAGHPDFDKILEHISERNKISPIELTLSSLRADLTSENVIRTLVECGQRNATIAIEAGSDRLRKLINKDLTEGQIYKTIETARLGGLKGLKIYAMIGHPTETQEDIQAIVDLMKGLKQANKGFDLTLSVSTFIPKLFTPFQWCKKPNSKELDDKFAFLKKHLAKVGVKLRPTSVDWDSVQAILSRYQGSLASYLIEVNENGGNLGAFKQIWRLYSKKGLLPEFNECAENTIPEDPYAPLASDFLDVNNKDALIKRYNEIIKTPNE